MTTLEERRREHKKMLTWMAEYKKSDRYGTWIAHTPEVKSRRAAMSTIQNAVNSCYYEEPMLDDFVNVAAAIDRLKGVGDQGPR